MMLSESELNVIRQMWHSEQVVSLAGVGLLLDHIEAQEADCAAMRQALIQLARRLFVCPECFGVQPQPHTANCTLARNLSGTAGQALLDELAQLRGEVARLAPFRGVGAPTYNVDRFYLDEPEEASDAKVVE